MRERFSAVAHAMDWLNGYGAARLSGSGGCMFLAVGSHAAASAIAAECPVGMRAFVARGVAQSPLLARMRAWNRLSRA
jgi:4-diphosphocytidyl-2-C-methyl-D-erythritol kinase